jgi:hypothetical protein
LLGVLEHDPSHWFVPPQEPHEVPKFGGVNFEHEPSHRTVPPHEPQVCPTFGEMVAGAGGEHDPSHCTVPPQTLHESP